MGLWLEHRDEDGRLTDRVRFAGGHATLETVQELLSFKDGVEEWKPMTVSVKDAMNLSRPFSHMPPEKRQWALRIGFDEG